MNKNVSNRISLSKEFLIEECIVKNKSDKFIANELGFSKTTICKLRKKYGIEKSIKTWELARLKVLEKLKIINENVIYVKNEDKTKGYDFKLEKIKIQVKSSIKTAELSFKFQMSNSEKCGVKTGVNKTKTGRTLKKYSEFCDFLILVCIDEIINYYIIPINVIPSNMQTISISECGKYEIYKNNWDLLINYKSED